MTFDGPGPVDEIMKRQDHIINGRAVCAPSRVWCRGGVVWFSYTLPSASPVYRACRLAVSPLALVSLFSSAGCLLRRLSPGNEVWQVEIKRAVPPPLLHVNHEPPAPLSSRQPMDAVNSPPQHFPGEMDMELTSPTNATPEPAALPAGWRQAVAPDGRTYYENDMTKVTQWEHPAAAAAEHNLPMQFPSQQPMAAGVMH